MFKSWRHILSRARLVKTTAGAAGSGLHSNDDPYGQPLSTQRPCWSFSFPEIRAVLSSVAQYDNSLHLNDPRRTVLDIFGLSYGTDDHENHLSTFVTKFLKGSQTVC